MRGKKFVCMGLAALLALPGCQKNPEGSIVANKDFDKMVGQAQEGGNRIADVAAEVPKETYQDTFSNESLGVTVSVNAQVDIPAANQMSIVRIRKKDFSQEFLDQVREALMPGMDLYDASLLHTPTRAEVEEQISGMKEAVKDAEARFAAGEIDRETLDQYKEEYQKSINDLQQEYEAAPEEISLEGHPSDGKLHKVADLVSQNPESNYYQWQQSLNPEGSIYEVAGKGGDGRFHTLYAQNNENYGNGIRYENSIGKYLDVASVLPAAPLNSGFGDIWKASEEPRLNMDIQWKQTQEVDNEPATRSLEEARGVAEELMKRLNLNEFQCYQGELYSQYRELKEETLMYRNIYVFQYLRNLDGVFVNNESIGKHDEGWRGDTYVKKDWPGESVVVYVNDSGVAGFYCVAPIETVETVVENASLKSFEEIKGIFRQMIVMEQASEVGQTTIEVNRVTLRYARISEADRFDTGLLVPVWEFEGSRSGDYRDHFEGNLLSINAIDGTVIDAALGY